MGFLNAINLIRRRIMLSYSLFMTANAINGLIGYPAFSSPFPGLVSAESSKVLMKRSGGDMEMSATFTSSTSASQPATSTLVAAPSFVMIPTANGQFVQPFILPATTQVGGPLMINGQLTGAAQPLMLNGNSGGSAPRRRIRVIRPGGGGGGRGGGRRARFRGGGGGRGRRFRRPGGGGGGGGRSAPIVIVDSGSQQGQMMSQPLIQPMVQPIIQPMIQPVVSQQPFLGNPLVQSHPAPVQVPSVTSISVTAQPQTSPPALYQTTVTSVQDNKSKNLHNPTVFVPAAPVVNLMMLPTVTEKPRKGRRESLRDRRRNRVRTRVKLRLKEWVNTES